MKYLLVGFLITVFTLGGGLLGYIILTFATMDFGFTLSDALTWVVIGAIIGFIVGICLSALIWAINKFFQQRIDKK